MSPQQEIVGSGLLLIGLYVITRFYWLRVVSCAVLLTIWGIITLAVPIYLAYDDINDGRLFGAIFTLAVCVPMTGCWYIGFKAAHKWVVAEISFGRWTKMPWLAR
jgi:uncharacterized membrane protein